MKNKIYLVEAEFFKALAHPTRMQILDLLRAGEKCVCEITPALGFEQPNVSRHLAVLKREGLVRSRKEGLKVIYWITDPRLYQIIDLSSEILIKMLSEKSALVGQKK